MLRFIALLYIIETNGFQVPGWIIAVSWLLFLLKLAFLSVDMKYGTDTSWSNNVI